MTNNTALLNGMYPGSVELIPTGLPAQLVVGVHDKHPGCAIGCCIHSPSNHHMLNWPLHWRSDKYMMERICPHGVGHPDPDHIGYMVMKHGLDTAMADAIHGCDGCCNFGAHENQQ